MVHDPCNPMPGSAMPAGLGPRPLHAARPVPGGTRPAPVQSHALTTIAPVYLGCDHRQPDTRSAYRIKPVPTISMPAADIPRASAIVVATLPSYYPPVTSFGGIPEGPPELLPMPEPSSAAMFLFAAFIAWAARRIELPRWTPQPLFALALAPAPKARHRHRSKSIAVHYACRTAPR